MARRRLSFQLRVELGKLVSGGFFSTAQDMATFQTRGKKASSLTGVVGIRPAWVVWRRIRARSRLATDIAGDGDIEVVTGLGRVETRIEI